MRRFLPWVLVSSMGLLVLAGCSGGGSSTSTSTSTGSNTGGSTGSNTGGSTGTSTPPTNPQTNPAPTISGLNPLSVLAGSSDTTVVISGTNFMSTTTVSLNGTELKTTYLTATTIQVVIPASALSAGQEIALVVTNPNSDTTATPTAKFTVMSPTPSIRSLSPNEVPQGADAVITVTGSGFEANSVVMYNGSARATTFVDSNTLRVTLTAKDVTSFGSGQVTVYNPGPGGSTTTPTQITILASKPTITYVSPSSLTVNTSTNVPTTLYVSGSGFAANATLQVNGTFLPITTQTSTTITASLAPSFLATAGTLSLLVTNPGSPAVQSNTLTISVVAPTYSMAVSPNSAAAGSPDLTITINASGTANLFYADSVVKWNDQALATTFKNSRMVTATIPAALLSGFAAASISVVTPETANDPQPPAQPFTTYLPLPTNDIVYNAMDGLIYASIPGYVTGGLGNTISAIDPASGAIVKSINVGSEPSRIALSSDGKKLWVGLNGAGAVRQVDLTTNTAGVQFTLGGGPGMYNAPYTAQDLAVVPGQSDSVVVYSNNGVVTVYDSGVARPNASSNLNVYFNSNSGSLSFGNSASTLYLNAQTTGSTLYALTLDSNGVVSGKPLGAGSSGTGSTLQYDNGRVYLNSGAVLDATNGAQLGQFSVMSNTQTAPIAASGPVVSDSALGRAWIVPNSYLYSSPNSQIVAYDESTFNPVGSLPVTGISSSYSALDIIRWGQNGLAVRTSTQIYVVQSPLVKDLTSSPAEVSVGIQSSATATTGSPTNLTIQAVNQGPNAASGVVVTTVLPTSVTAASFTATQGTCTGTQILYCNFGTIANGSSASVTITATPTTAGTLSPAAYLESVSYDPSQANNQATASVTVTGSDYYPTPYVSQLSPSLIEAGTTSPVLSVAGAGFSSTSSIRWNGQTIPTTYVSSSQLTAVLDSSLVSQIGWASVAVSSPSPGGGQSGGSILHIYKKLDLPATAMTFDPYSQKLYATLPSTSTKVTGNSLVVIDPFSGSTGSPINVGSEPTTLAETTDGTYMFIGLSGAKSLGRFNMKTQAVDLTVPLTVANYSGTTAGVPTRLAAVPGSNSTVAVEIQSTGIGIFDITGSTGAFRSSWSGIYAGNQPAFADATHLYAYDSQTTGAEFYRYTLGPTGLSVIDGTTLNGIGGFNGSFRVDSGVVFGGYGGIVNPNTTPPSQVAVLPVSSSSGSTIGGVVPYQAEAKAFFIGSSTSGSGYYLKRFDTTTFRMDHQVQLPGLAYDAWTGTRFGQDGIAILASPTSYSSSQQTSQILLLRGPFILPAEASTNSAPSLTSISSTTVAAGSGNQMLTITGSGFIAGATATWNGAARTTTFVDSAHVQIAIPRSDVATAGSGTIKVANPGSGDSNSLTVTVQ